VRANDSGIVTRIRTCLVALLLPILAACGTIPQRPARLEPSSLGCMSAVLEEKLPAELTDDRAHCVAAGLIARYCGVFDAHLAGVGKEMRDLFGRGDAAWRDWRADRKGIRCAQRAQDDAALTACCESP
jgi:hypothetical protein